MKSLTALLKRHTQAFWYALTVLLPVVLKTGKRPVLFNRFTGMGDIICTIPAARELKPRHPGATFIYNCHRDFTAVPKLAGVADKITSLESIGLIGHWYGFLLGEYYSFAHGDDTSGKVATEPMVTEFCRQFDLPPIGQHPQINPSVVAKEKVSRLLVEKNLDPQKLVLIHPGPSWTVKEWPREHWSHLLKRLRELGHTSIAQLGVGRYMNFGQVAVEPILGAVSLLDLLSVEECFALMGQARLFIGIDSGLLHIAACMQTPAVGLWGCTDPKNFYEADYRKEFVVSQVACAGCYHRLPRLHWVTGCPHDIRCMKEMAVEPVLQACLKKLSDIPNPK